jgi:hypothetical protein
MNCQESVVNTTDMKLSHFNAEVSRKMPHKAMNYGNGLGFWWQEFNACGHNYKQDPDTP